MPRILFLAPAAQSGGAECVLLDLLAEIRANHPHLTPLLIAGEDGPLLDQARDLDVQAESMPFPRVLADFGESGKSGESGGSRAASLLKIAPAVLQYAWRLRRRIRQLRPDVIHSNGLKMHLLSALSSPRPVPLIWHLHDYPGSRPLSARLLRMAQRRCRQIVANSQSVARDAETLFSPAHVPITTIMNGIDLERFSPEGSRLDLDALAGLPPAVDGTIRVGLLATFARWKGHRVFLEAAARIESHLPIRFYIIGGPIYQTPGSQLALAELRALAEKLHLAGRVGFTGSVADVPAALRSLDIAVHASTQPEPFGLVIAQAMACAKAVVIARSGGAVELALEDREALFHTPGSSEELAACILRVAMEPRLRERLRNAAQARAHRDWSRERMARQFSELYRDLARSARPEAESPRAASPASPRPRRTGAEIPEGHGCPSSDAGASPIRP